MKTTTKEAWSATGSALLATTLLLGVSSPANAQHVDGQRFSIEPRAGIAIPAGDLSDVADAGPGLGLGLAYTLTDRLAVRLDGDVDILSGLDATATNPEGPDVTIWHYGAGLQYALLDPASSRWAVDVNLGIGASTFDVDEFSVGASTIDVTETYFTANGGLQVGYDVTPGVNVFGRGQAFLMFTDEDDTAVFSAFNPDIDPAGFDSAWSIPLSVGVAIYF
ncbi:MAG: outer membrane beta-barrel protein [Gemmatimonadota bacterium]